MGFSFRNLTAATLALGALTAFAGGANAQTALAPGTTVAPANLGAGTPYVGAPLASIIGGTYANATGLAGNFDALVYATPGGGGLDFLYQFTPTSGTVVNFGTQSFAGFTTSVGYYDGDPNGATAGFVAGTAAPLDAVRTVAPGTTITFGFGNGVEVGQVSEVLLIRVAGATAVNQGLSTWQGVGGSNDQFTFAPINPQVSTAPEPGTVALVAMGLMGTAGMVIRRRK